MPFVAALASLRLTLAGFGLLAALLVYGRLTETPVDTAVAAPFALLAVNLIAALVANPRLRGHLGLLVFHLALAAIAGLAAIGRLAGLSGHVEVTEGTAFDSRLVVANAGPLHRWRLDRVRFVQGGFDINYAPGMKREDTKSRVFIPGGTDGGETVVVGDDRPLVIGGYRFYTSFNKGFAPLLRYAGANGEAVLGTVHLPSYPLNYYQQGNEWTPPDGSRRVKLWLHLPRPGYVEDARWRFRAPDDAVLVVMDGGARRELRPGETMRLGAGTLRYEELRGWMGYTISYDPTVPWILGACAAGAVGLAWHVAGKLRRNPIADRADAETAHGV